MTNAGFAQSRFRTLRASAAAVLALVSAPAFAQAVQGPPDGFRPPISDRAPAQGPADDGIAPLGPPPRVDPRPSAPEPAPVRAAATLQPPAAGLPTTAAAGSAPSRGPARTAPSPPAARTEPVSTANPSSASPVAAPAVVPDVGDPAVSVTPPSLEPPPPAAVELPTATQESVANSPWWQKNWAVAVLAALVALLVAGLTLLFWRRRRLADPDAVALAAPPPAPLPQPSRDLQALPTPPRPAPQPIASPPEPMAAPVPLPVVAGRARLTLTLQVNAVEITGDSARFSITLLLANSGDRDAIGGLVRIALQQAHPQQAAMLERFFDGAGGSILAEDVEIAAGDVGSIVRHAVLPLDAVEPMLIGGYPSLVPVIGFDTSYHWDGEGEAFGQVAAAYVIGTASGADGRVAPVRLDHGPRRLANPVARVTEMQRLI